MPEHLLLWIVFNVLVLGILVLDLGVFHREAHVVSLREALVWSCIWVSLALLFGLGIYSMQGGEKSLEFMAGYLIEWSLSVDNLFVFLVIFSYFAVPAIYQHRLLFWGILGALVLRAVFIATGTALLSNFHWMVYVFGVFLIFTGIKLMFAGGDEIEPEKNPAVRLVRRFIKITAGFEGQRFFVRKDGKLWATPLFLVLVVIETTDVIFALDSIPAIFAITLDPFIVYTSNVFAILGLRALFFLLAGVMGMFRYLKVGLSFVLCFVGVKMTIVNFYKIPIGVSLGVVAGILAISVLASLMIQPKSTIAHAPRLAPDPLQRSGTAIGEAASWRSSIWSWLLVIAVVMAVVAAISTCAG
jgi:tellurite resistance protein TerC